MHPFKDVSPIFYGDVNALTDEQLSPLLPRLFLWKLAAHTNQTFTSLSHFDVNDDIAVGERKVTLLYMSIYGNLIDPVLTHFLLRHGASPAVRVDGQTILQHALTWQERSYYTLHGASCDHRFPFTDVAIAMVNYMSPEQLADINKNGESVLLAGVLSRSIEFVRSLRSYQLVNHPGKSGRTPLIATAHPHSILILVYKIITRHGNVGVVDGTSCQVNQLEQLGITDDSPRESVYQWSLLFVEELLRMGADVNQYDDHGSSALHIAAYAGNVPVVKRLLTAGALSFMDNEGRLPADLAAARGFTDAVSLLSGNETQVVVCTPRHCPPLDALRTHVFYVTGHGDVSERRNNTCNIIETGNLTFDEFQLFWKFDQPVMIRGAIHPDVTQSFSIDNILERYGSVELKAADTVTGKRSVSYSTTLHDYITRARSAKNHTRYPSTIVETRDNNELLHDIVEFAYEHVPVAEYPDVCLSSSPWTLGNHQLNIGVKGSCTAIHFHESAVNIVFTGRKRWLLFPPTDAFYDTRHVADAMSADATPSRAMECTQNAGDVIFVPSGWGHGVSYEEETVGLGVLYNGGIVNSN
jgi:ankyrin repeat protein